jgi:hypothetical protein
LILSRQSEALRRRGAWKRGRDALIAAKSRFLLYFRSIIPSFR